MELASKWHHRYIWGGGKIIVWGQALLSLERRCCNLGCQAVGCLLGAAVGIFLFLVLLVLLVFVATAALRLIASAALIVVLAALLFLAAFLLILALTGRKVSVAVRIAEGPI